MKADFSTELKHNVGANLLLQSFLIVGSGSLGVIFPASVPWIGFANAPVVTSFSDDPKYTSAFILEVN